ncbi:hypothetical protein GF342_05565 [Candidatus Woesearchaeota archaeon]|nr:hypothetical protein [Candidatus Woesearchaeota archaeon]
MVFALLEIVDMIAMTLIVGYIFLDIFARYTQSWKEAFILSMWAVAPGIILHELGHKFVGMAFGYVATFNAAYLWLGIGLLLKMMSGFAFFVPAYVSISCADTCLVHPLVNALIAFSGPAINAILWAGSWYALKHYTFKPQTRIIVGATMQINKLLFFFNMLPIPMFDGFAVYSGLFNAIF